MSSKGNEIFVPYKALGQICASVPLGYRRVGGGKQRHSVILAAIGTVVQQFNARSLKLTSVSDSLPSNIIALHAHPTITIAACEDGKIYALRNNRTICSTFQHVSDSSYFHLLLTIGDHLIAVNKNCIVCVWHLLSGELINEMRVSSFSFAATAICHPDTYVNKIVLGSQEGSLLLLNVRTATVIYNFGNIASSPITCLSQSPAVDVVGIGCANGDIFLKNLKTGDELIRFMQDNQPVSAITFRTDGPPIMITATGNVNESTNLKATSSSEATVSKNNLSKNNSKAMSLNSLFLSDLKTKFGIGNLSVWDLEKQQLIGQMVHAHKAKIHTAICLHGESIMITAGDDNAIRSWSFDLSDGLARQLVERECSLLPATCVRFYDGDGEQILLSSLDSSIRSYNAWRDSHQFNFGLSTNPERKRNKRHNSNLIGPDMKPPLVFDANEVREMQWDNVVSIHNQSPTVLTWSTNLKKLGKHRLVHERFGRHRILADATARSASLSPCGNQVVIGYSTGHIDVYNIQSGKLRITLSDGVDAEPDFIKAHTSPVMAVIFDLFNRFIISGDANGALRFWHNKTGKLLRTVKLKAGVSHLRQQKINDLLAVAHDNGAVNIADIDTMRPVRRFQTNATSNIPLTDLTFDYSGKYLFTSSLDKTLKIWHLATLTLIDVMRFDFCVTSLSLSKSNYLLATTHAHQRGAFIWGNRLLRLGLTSAKPLPLDYMPTHVTSLPVIMAGIDTIEEQAQTMSIRKEEEENVASDPHESETEATNFEEKDELLTVPDVLTLMTEQSILEWSALPHLDAIRKHNKEALETKIRQLKHAPFFLPTKTNLQGFEFDTIDVVRKREKEKESSRLLKRTLDNVIPVSPFINLLRTATISGSEKDMTIVFERIRSMRPTALDLELRAMKLRDVNTRKPSSEALALIRAVNKRMTDNQDFDLCQIIINTFLNINRMDIANAHLPNDELMSELRETRRISKMRYHSVQELSARTIGVLQWLKSAAITE